MVHNSKLNIMHFSYRNEKSESLQQVVDCSSEEKKENLEFENDNLQHDTSDMLTLEGLKRQYYSCSNCGVSWYDDHISLDCSECGGYAMCRPCPECNGQCGSIWRRDVESVSVNHFIYYCALLRD
ncbi:protein pinocchio-like [Stegodyphus dumicola]|uniref:protein pinocchio-like n=1 Tax=Stegodyphus dumicola TaxID=202533 RepID=UPI0015AB31A4|nr:protein pinocchio-like [Stegodyphus dumicola]